jgi:hypothetical protein
MPLSFFSAYKIPRRWLEYLITEGMDSAVYFAVFPFLFHLTEHMTDDHHTSTAITNFGLLIALISLGRIISRDSPVHPDLQDIPYLAILMTTCLLLVTFSNNYSVVAVVYFLKECIGGFMSKTYAHLYQSLQPHKLFVNQSTSNADAVGMPFAFGSFTGDILMRRNLTICIFAVLFSSSLYMTSERFPGFYPFVILIIAWNAAVAYYFVVYMKANLESTHQPASPRRRANSKVSRKQSTRVRSNTERERGLKEYLSKANNIPQNFLDVCRGNEDRARSMYRKALQWRYEHDVDNILTLPQNHFHDIMRLWPHAIHGRSRDGCVVLYEILGRAKIRDLVAAGINLPDLIWHFNLRNEYVFQKVLVDENQQPTWGHIMTIVDIKGISFRDLSTDVISFIKENSDTIDNYYPLRVKRLIIINVPSWFSSVWSVITSVLPQAVRDKIHILHGIDGLDEIVAEAERPVEYGGTNGTFGSVPEHQGFVALTKAWENIRAETPSLILDEETAPIHSSRTSTRDAAAAGKQQSSSWSVKNLWRSQASPTRAHLGQKNSYRFDDESRTWTLDAEDEDKLSSDDQDASDDGYHSPSEEADAERSSSKRLEEHGLLLAIQAAHIAAQSMKDTALNTSASSSSIMNLSNRADASSSQIFSNVHEMSGESSSAAPPLSSASFDSQQYASSSSFQSSSLSAQRSILATGNANYGSKLAPEIFLLALSMYLGSAFMHVATMVIVPIWMILPNKVGGLGYTVVDLGLVFSSTAILLLLVDTYLRERLLFILKSSPLRLLRISTTILAMASILLPLILGGFVNSEGIVREDQQALSTTPGSSRQTIEVVLTIISRTPKDSLLYLPTPCILLASFGKLHPSALTITYDDAFYFYSQRLLCNEEGGHLAATGCVKSCFPQSSRDRARAGSHGRCRGKFVCLPLSSPLMADI